MVLYGEEEEEMMANSNDPIIKTIWQSKIEAEYSPVPQIRSVYDRKSVFIDWKSGIESAINVRYTTRAGDPLIHVAPDPVFMPKYPGMHFVTLRTYKVHYIISDCVDRQGPKKNFIPHWNFTGPISS